MRKLKSQELEWIHTRLKSLYIRYTEVYQEIFDHYCTTLEQSPAIESPAIIAKLNDTFAWSVVKNMDKELERNVSKQVLTSQLDFLKFWNHGLKGILIGIFGLVALAIPSFIIPASELILVFLVLIFCTTGGIYYMKRDAMNFSFQHKSVSVSSLAVLKKVGILNSLICWLYALPSILTRGDIHSNKLFTIELGLATIISILYSISLLVIAANLPKSKLI